MKKGKTFLTLLSAAGIITVITMTISHTATTHLEKELALKTNTDLIKKALPTPTAAVTPEPTPLPTVPPSPTPLPPIPTAEPTPVPTPTPFQIALPVSGAEVLSDYTEDILVFQATYGDYRIHTGIDFGGEKGTPILAAADGIVSKNSFDYETGYTVELTHEGEYLTRYCNLENDKAVTVGQVVTQGEQIGTLGEVGIFEAHLPSHLHFELEQNGEPTNPQEYLYNALPLQ